MINLPPKATLLLISVFHFLLNERDRLALVVKRCCLSHLNNDKEDFWNGMAQGQWHTKIQNASSITHTTIHTPRIDDYYEKWARLVTILPLVFQLRYLQMSWHTHNYRYQMCCFLAVEEREHGMRSMKNTKIVLSKKKGGSFSLDFIVTLRIVSFLRRYLNSTIAKIILLWI